MTTFPGEQPPHIEGQLPLSAAGEVERVIYLHQDKDSNWGMWEDDLEQPDNKAGRNFSYTLLEVGIACRINVETGKVAAYGVEHGDDIVKLEREVEV